MERTRGPYRRYNIDPSIPIPKTTLWRMKKSGLEPAVNRVGLQEDSEVDLSGKLTCEFTTYRAMHIKKWVGKHGSRSVWYIIYYHACYIPNTVQSH